MVLKSITEKKTNEPIKQALLNSLQKNDNVEEQRLNETANYVNNSQEAILIINFYRALLKQKIRKQ